MIVNIEQRHQKLIISYVNKLGEIGYTQFNIPPQEQFSWGLTKYKTNADPEFKSWDGKAVTKMPTEFLDPHRIQEFFLSAGDDLTKHLFEFNLPKLYSWDIEVEVTDDGFPDAENANNRINTMAWSCYPDVTVFGLKPLSSFEINEIESNINKHVKKFNKEYKFIYKQFNNEADLIYDFCYNYLRHAPLVTGWNLWSYDWRYLTNRCKKLNIDISWLSPTKQWYAHNIMDRNKKVKLMLPQHKLVVDYMTIYQKWDRSIDVKENSSLDFVSDSLLGINKVKYPGTFQDLYNKDFDKYVFYNAIDTILVELIHEKIKTMNIFLGLSNLTRVQAMTAFSPIAMLESTLSQFAYKYKKVFPKTKQHNERKEYEGAFVYEPKPGMYEWVASLDFRALYPTIISQFNISIENYLGKDKHKELKQNEVRCVSNAIFDKNNDPLIPEILKYYTGERRNNKNKMLEVEKEISLLKNVLKEREKNLIV